MDFILEFYETVAGNCPVQKFLDELKAGDPDDFAVVVAGLAKLRNRQYHREPLSKALGDGLFELRHVGKLNTRVLWFFMKNRRIVLLHGIRNKGRAILPPRRNGWTTGGKEQNNEKNQFRSLSRHATAGSDVCRPL